MKCRIDGTYELLSFLNRVADVDETAKQMLSEGGEILNREARKNVRDAANRGYATGDLASSIVPTKPEKNKYGRFVVVKPVGTDSKGVRNGEKWGYLEHGVPGKQEAHPFIDRTISAAEPKCGERMQEIFNEHIKWPD